MPSQHIIYQSGQTPYLYSDQSRSKTTPFEATHTDIDHKGKEGVQFRINYLKETYLRSFASCMLPKGTNVATVILS